MNYWGNEYEDNEEDDIFYDGDDVDFFDDDFDDDEDIDEYGDYSEPMGDYPIDEDDDDDDDEDLYV